MSDVTIAYFPVIGRGEQVRLICALHGVSVTELASTPLGEDFDKDKEAPFGTVPWMKDHSNGLELNDSLAIVQYLVSKYDGPLTPNSPEGAAKTAMYWGWVQDYYSFVLSPMHDIITGHNEVFWRNLRLTDTLAEGGKETAIANLAKLHNARLGFLEKHLESQNAGPFLMGEDCSYADIFLFTCVRTVENTQGFGMLRAVVGESPFADFPITGNIAASVGDMELVKASVGNKFSECPI
jgi:glutathione S-transferase